MAETDPRPGAATPSSLPFDLDAIVAQVRFAYRRSEASGRFEGGHATYAVEADARRIELRAFHAPDERVQGSEAQESEALQLEAELARGGRVLAARGAGIAEVAEDGHLTITRGEVVEHLRNGEEGVEQSWSFAERPSGSGDLTVRIAVRGMRHVGNTETGVHLADPSGLGFRYGHGTWIDATGARAAVPARWAEGAIELRVPAAVVESAGYPALLDPIISPEFGMDQPVPSPGGGSQSEPSVASNGTDYLVVWQDSRRSSSASDLYAMRVSPAGALLDASAFLVAARGRSPRVASDGTDYLVVWEDGGGSTSIDIYGARVSAAGTVLDAPALAIATAAGVSSMPEVASSGAEYLVVWQDGRDVRGARVSAAGGLLDASSLVIATGAREASVASNGTDYLVVWQQPSTLPDHWNDDIHGARVSAAGAVLDPGGFAISTAAHDQITPRVASNGTDYLVVWQDGRTDWWDVYGARVSAAGVVLDESGLPIATGLGYERSPAVASNGTDYLVVWEEETAGIDISAARVSAAGVVLDGSAIAISAPGPTARRSPCVASNGADFLIAWDSRWDFSHGTIYATRVTGAGAVDDDAISVVVTGNAQFSPSVASNGTDYLVVWEDSRGGIHGIRVSATGAVLDPTGFSISTAASHWSQSASVASNGIDYLVAWYGHPGIYGARVSATGTVLDPTALVIAASSGAQPTTTTIASNGTDYLVAWPDSFRVYATRVSATGIVLDGSPIALPTGGRSQARPSAASNGTDYLVVWESGGLVADVYAARVSASGTVQGESALVIWTDSSQQLGPRVASNGSDYLVVWRDGYGRGIYGARVSDRGAVVDQDGIPIATLGWAVHASPSVAANGTDYLVVWNDTRNGSREMYGTRVRAGVVESPDGMAFATAASQYEATPALAAGPPGQFLLAYQRFVPEAPYVAERVQARLIQYHEALGEPCRADAQCESGLCVDGVCCDRACGGGAIDDCQACAVAAGAAVDGTCGPSTGNACDDGAACTTSDRCAAGVCEGRGDPCVSGTTCTEDGGGYACSACPAGTHSANGTGSTACVECAVGTWSGIGATSCVEWSTCGAGEYESAAPTTTGDRECRACTVCGTGEVVSAPCSARADTVCVAMPDAGTNDAGTGDAGMGDGGASDAGASDAGTGDAGTGGGGGCGCAAAGAGASSRGALALFGLGLALALRRRARASAR